MQESDLITGKETTRVHATAITIIIIILVSSQTNEY